jgi:hypothetical protein
VVGGATRIRHKSALYPSAQGFKLEPIRDMAARARAGERRAAEARAEAARPKSAAERIYNVPKDSGRVTCEKGIAEGVAKPLGAKRGR